MDSKVPGDLVYVLGVTRNELGASEYYQHLDYTGLNVPQVRPQAFKEVYRALERAIADGLPASVHGVYRGGLGIHLILVAMAGNHGLQAELARLPREGVDRSDTALFSESAGRFIVTVDPKRQGAFETLFEGLPCACVGRITEEPVFSLSDLNGRGLASMGVPELKAAWKRPFGDLI
jgi:phosphoribosylformylglycinamidine (FGAM) synthase-like enzyme